MLVITLTIEHTSHVYSGGSEVTASACKAISWWLVYWLTSSYPGVQNKLSTLSWRTALPLTEHRQNCNIRIAIYNKWVALILADLYSYSILIQFTLYTIPKKKKKRVLIAVPDRWVPGARFGSVSNLQLMSCQGIFFYLVYRVLRVYSVQRRKTDRQTQYAVCCALSSRAEQFAIAMLLHCIGCHRYRHTRPSYAMLAIDSGSTRVRR